MLLVVFFPVFFGGGDDGHGRAAGLDQTNADVVISVTDAYGDLYSEHRTLNSEPRSFPVLFDRAGTFTADATLNGSFAGPLTITVVQVDLEAPIACQIGYRRKKGALV